MWIYYFKVGDVTGAIIMGRIEQNRPSNTPAVGAGGNTGVVNTDINKPPTTDDAPTTDDDAADTDSASTGDAATSGTDPAAVTKELEDARAEIARLNAQLASVASAKVAELTDTEGEDTGKGTKTFKVNPPLPPSTAWLRRGKRIVAGEKIEVSKEEESRLRERGMIGPVKKQEVKEVVPVRQTQQPVNLQTR